jgi:hypothetical protein
LALLVDLSRALGLAFSFDLTLLGVEGALGAASFGALGADLSVVAMTVLLESA